MNIVVTVPHGDLREDKFEFYYIDTENRLRFARYTRSERATKRHKFATVAGYPRNYANGRDIKEYEVPLTAEVIEQARAVLLARVAEVRLPEPHPRTSIPGDR